MLKTLEMTGRGNTKIIPYHKLLKNLAGHPI